MDSVGGSEGGIIWENSTETCVLPYVKIDDQFNSWSMVLKAGALGQPRGIEGEGMWEGFQDGGKHVHHGWFMSMHGKNHHNIVKYLSSN